ncbi:MAG: T9SS type A sorting domain-containing protein, partial [Candidatus Syntrophosphaera sp.]
MKTTYCLLTALLLFLIIPAQAAEIFVVNSTSRTLTRIDTDTGETDNSFAHLGLTPNLMDLDEDHIYIACSGDNAIQVVSRQSGAHIRYIPIAPSCNPWDVLKVDDHLYVTGLFTDTLYKVSLQSNSVVGSLQVGTAPEGLAHSDGRLFVCNTGGYANNYANSSLSVIDLASFAVTDTIPVWTNPQYATARDGFIHVSCTGNWSDAHGKVDVINAQTLEHVARLDIGGNPGNIWITPDGMAYLGDGMGWGLYSYDADTHEVYHDSSDPLDFEAYDISGNTELMAFLDLNWSSNSLVRTYAADLALLDTYSVGISATDILVAPLQTAAADHVQSAAPSVYPNPLPRGSFLNLALKSPGKADFELYNLRGQLVHRSQA